MLNTPCPYQNCRHPEMPEPPHTPRPYATCPKCGRRSRARLYAQSDGPRIVIYSAVGRRYAVREKDGDWHVRGNKGRVGASGVSAQALFDWALDNYGAE